MAADELLAAMGAEQYKEVQVAVTFNAGYTADSGAS